MLSRYLARRKMRWAVRRLARMSWSERTIFAHARSWRRTIAPLRILQGLARDQMREAQAFDWREVNLDRLNPTK